MRIIKFYFVLFITMSSLIYSQEIKVKQINQITDLSKGEFYCPKFSPVDSKLFFTSSNYQGIWYYDFDTKKVNNITTQDGAGYEFIFSPDGKNIIYRTQKYEGMKKYYSIIEQNISTKEIKNIEIDRADLYPPQLTSDNKISYAVNSELNSYEINAAQNKLQKSVFKPVVIIDNQKIVLFQDGVKKILAPFGDGNYIWPSVSPDNQKILFTFAGKGTFVSDLNGNIISSIGIAHAPQWSPDGKWIVYMVDKDNGVKVTSSDIFVSSVDGTKKIQLTATQDILEMYPVWSPDGSKVAFNSEDGKIYLLELNID